jgi:hypothetical protein
VQQYTKRKQICSIFIFRLLFDYLLHFVMILLFTNFLTIPYLQFQLHWFRVVVVNVSAAAADGFVFYTPSGSS